MYIVAYFNSTSPVSLYRKDWREFVNGLLKDSDCNGITVRPMASYSINQQSYARLADGWKRVR